MSAPDGGDHFVGLGTPSKINVVIIEEAIDGRLKGARGAEDAALQALPSTALSLEAEVGVKWNVHRGCRVSYWRTAGCLWAA